MKYFLLTAGHAYYPESGDGDWIRCFETYEEAKEQVAETVVYEYWLDGPLKGHEKYSYPTNIKIDGKSFDWYEIIDLRTWMEK